MNKIILTISIVVMLASCQRISTKDNSANKAQSLLVNKKENTMNNFKSGTNKVQFRSQGFLLAGLLFTPENFDPAKQYPTVVFSGPVLQVKEQMGTNYGEAFAKNGYIFLSFDHIGHGDSEGEAPHENGFLKIESIRDAISYLNTLDFVDKEKLFGIGGCASGAYMPLVAVTDKRLKGLATISGRSNNINNYFEAMSKEEYIKQVTAANEARQRMYETGTVVTSDAFAVYEGRKSEDFPEGLVRDGFDYYMTDRGRAENFSSVSQANIMEYVPLLDAATFAPYFYMPYVGVIGENAQTGFTTRTLYERAEEPKELVVIKGASHVSLYDHPEQVKQVVDSIDKFWKNNVK